MSSLAQEVEKMKEKGRDQVVLYGSKLTKDDLKSLPEDLTAFVAMDSVDPALKLEALDDSQVLPTTFESLTMECIRTFKDPEFKPILNLAKDRPPTQKM